VQRQQDVVEEVSQVLFNYAELIGNGMDPESALLSTAQSLQDKRRGAFGDLENEGVIPGTVPSENFVE
jgi:hypothetical protein